MRQLSYVVVSVVLMAPFARAAERPPVAIAVVSPDRARALDIEIGLREKFSAQGMDTVGLTSLAQSSTTLDTVTAELQSKGVSRLLCVSARPTIELAPEPGTVDRIQDCLTALLSGTQPGGGSAKSDPPITAQLLPSQVGGGRSLPVSKIAHYKGLERLYDTASGNLLWRQPVDTRVPDEMRNTFQLRRIVDALWTALKPSGVVPARP